MNPIRHGGTLGVFITLLLMLGLIILGLWLTLRPSAPTTTNATTGVPAPAAKASGQRPAPPKDKPQPGPVLPITGVPRLDAAAAYVPKNEVLEIDISDYAGYAGLIAANGGLEPNPDSFFAKQYHFQVKLSKSEGEKQSDLNHGKYAAGATTVDVLAVYGRQFAVTVPVLIGFSRGADMVVVDRDVTSVNQLKGRVLAAAQHNESEFFIRYLAQEAGLSVRVLPDLNARPGPQELGLVFYEDAEKVTYAYHHALAGSAPRLNGCVGWSPYTDAVVEAAPDLARILVSNRNLLVVADILCVNRGLAQANPEQVKGLVHGILEGNRLVRTAPDTHLPVVAKALGWTVEDTRSELKKVHLANHAENLAFFKGTIDSAGSFAGIYQSARTAYAGTATAEEVDALRYHDPAALKALSAIPALASEPLAIAPINSSGRAAIEGEALLTKDIRFFFTPNSAELNANAPENAGFLDTIKGYLQVSPGSQILLRGHVDNSQIPIFQKEGGKELVRKQAEKAKQLSRDRAETVRRAIRARVPSLAADRIDIIGCGWDEPAGTDPDLNRRVEVRWFTLE